jgi:hypothetical protein
MGLSKLRQPPPQPRHYKGVLEGDVVGLVRIGRDVIEAPWKAEVEEALITEVAVTDMFTGRCTPQCVCEWFVWKKGGRKKV